MKTTRLEITSVWTRNNCNMIAAYILQHLWASWVRCLLWTALPVFCMIRSLHIEGVRITSFPVKTCVSVLFYLLCGEFYLVYSVKPLFKITLENLLLKGEKAKYG